MKRVLSWFTWILVLVVVVTVAAAIWARSQLHGSLPVLDGQRRLPGLSAPVTVARDDLGIPTIQARSRTDLARATGFLHAQDRYFQMDLTRRRAAGELSALVGVRALEADRDMRIHRFRSQARRTLGLLHAADREVLEAYTAGVNQGLTALASPPFEYRLLRQDPQPWAPEDSLLVVLSMFVTLQDSEGAYESTLGTMREVLPPAAFEFFAPRGTEWDTPITGAAFETPHIPGADLFNPRAKPSAAMRRTQWQRTTTEEVVGSNNWAVSGRLSESGAALVANDMHLTIRVPNTWYRAVLEWPGEPGAEPHRLMGTTLPGVPALVTGSNSFVVWGFTNTYADWSDVVMLELDPGDPSRYRTPEGWKSFDTFEETIAIAGEAPERMTVRWTQWGPVLPPDYRGRPRAYSWVAHSAERLAQSMTPFEAARSIEDVIEEANRLGTPGQNLVLADRSGRIAWTVYGAIPRRVGFDGQTPTAWADGERRWDGWLPAAEYPRLVDPPGGRLWTANARVVDGEDLAKLGDGSYDVGARARMIRDRLAAAERITARDMLDIQLDTRSVFLDRWRELLLRLLRAKAGSSPRRQELLRILQEHWSGNATPDSAAYRFTRTFRDTVSDRAFAFLLAACANADPTFDYRLVRRREGPLWRLVSEQPLHLLDPAYRDWDAFLIDAVDTAIEDAVGNADGPLDQRTWSEMNVTEYRHPLSAAIPMVGRWLDMPYAPLPGDAFTPRVANGSIGASVRMIVSPGREAEGIMHMPTGQSGHPLSPFYGNSHPAWVEGRPTPFLPGPATHTLTLTP